MAEPLHFDNRVLVTRDMATIDGVSYPIRAISSLVVREVPRKGGCLIPALMLGGCLVIVVTALSLVGSMLPDPGRAGGGPHGASPASAVTIMLVGVAMFGFGWSLQSAPPSYALVLGSAGGERHAVESADVAWLVLVRTALEEAMRG